MHYFDSLSIKYLNHKQHKLLKDYNLFSIFKLKINLIILFFKKNHLQHSL